MKIIQKNLDNFNNTNILEKSNTSINSNDAKFGGINKNNMNTNNNNF